MIVLHTHTARSPLFLLPALLAFVASDPAAAHEFWVRPANFFLASPDAPALISLSVGENFTGEAVYFSQGLVARFRQFSSAAEIDLTPGVPPDPVPTIKIAMPSEGTHVLALDTHPRHIVMPAEKFTAYLRAEGLDAIVRQRETAGKGALPGRERYRRNVKTLIRVGSRSDTTYSRRTGQMLEIVPMVDPLRARAGTEVAFQVLFDDRPLANARVKFWHNRAEQNPYLQGATREDGKIAVKLPWPGAWMASVVHMVPAADSSRHDWDSYWGNITFALPDAARKRVRQQ